jgi:hypothetical protein
MPVTLVTPPSVSCPKASGLSDSSSPGKVTSITTISPSTVGAIVGDEVGAVGGAALGDAVGLDVKNGSSVDVDKSADTVVVVVVVVVSGKPLPPESGSGVVVGSGKPPLSVVSGHSPPPEPVVVGLGSPLMSGSSVVDG